MDAVSEPVLAEDAAAVLFFDGVCNLCNRSIDFLIRRDGARRLRFAPLQGSTASSLLPLELWQAEELPSAVLLEGDRVSLRSSAVLGALRKIGGFWGALAAVGLLVPRPIRDWVYDLVVRRRYRIWGRRETCRLPTVEERAMFLD